MNILITLSIILFFICIIIGLLLTQNNNIKDVNYKIDFSFNELKSFLDKKIDILDRLINIIERELKMENKTFNKFKTIKSDKPSEFELDNLLLETSNLILTIKEDNPKLSKIKSFDGLIEELIDIENKLVALRTYYNKYTGKYNNLIKKKTYFLLDLIKKYKLRKFFEGKEIIDEVIV